MAPDKAKIEKDRRIQEINEKLNEKFKMSDKTLKTENEIT